MLLRMGLFLLQRVEKHATLWMQQYVSPLCQGGRALV